MNNDYGYGWIKLPKEHTDILFPLFNKYKKIYFDFFIGEDESYFYGILQNNKDCNFRFSPSENYYELSCAFDIETPDDFDCLGRYRCFVELFGRNISATVCFYGVEDKLLSQLKRK